MSIEKRVAPNVDQITPDLEVLLARFSDEEVETGIIARGSAASPDERLTAGSLLNQLNDALLQQPLT